MTPELTALTLAALLQVVQFALVSVSANLDLGPRKLGSARDPQRMGGKTVQDQLGIMPGRLLRAFNNHFEGLILFSIACFVVTLAGQSTKVTAAAAFTYLCARILYIPAYAFGWSPWRSLIWFVGFAATVTMLIAALI